MTTVTRCSMSDLPVESCACTSCAPHAVVIASDDLAYTDDGPRGVAPTAPPPPTFTATDLGRALADAVFMHGVLEDAMQGVRTGPDQEGGKSAQDGRPLPLRSQCADHRHTLLRGLRAWCAALQAASRFPVRGGGSVAMLAQALDVGQEWLDPSVCADVQAWTRRAHALADLPQLRGVLPLTVHGDMPVTDNGYLWGDLHRCDGTVQALLPADRDAQVSLSCRGCGMRWEVVDLPQAADHWLPVADASRLTGTPVRTIQHWVKFDVIAARGEPATVRLGEVLMRRGR